MTFKPIARAGSVLAAVILLAAATRAQAAATAKRERGNLDSGWKFIVGDPANAQDPAFDDQGWRTVNLPHDWSIEGKFDPKAPMGGGGGFLPAGVGWYRKRLPMMPTGLIGMNVSVEFEGVYENAEVWLNGQHLASHPYGYTSFVVDLTQAWKAGGTGVLAVRVDNSKQKNSRWYSGSGIYRHVWLTMADPVHVAPWGVGVAVPQATAEAATVQVQTMVANESGEARELKIRTVILSPAGDETGRAETDCQVPAGESREIGQELQVVHPALWSPETPQLSRVVTRVLEADRELDVVTTPFGVRTLAWGADQGLLLNGKALKLNGGCIHADNGVLGTAAFDRAEERKIQLLKEAGFNEVRISHHPASPALLDACDRLGMLVMEDAFDCWLTGKNSQDYHVYFKDWWERDLDAMVRRDRNHPSIICWDIGNEISDAYRPAGPEYTPKLVARIHALDRTRPVTEAIDQWPKDEQRAALDLQWDAEDIVGTNYQLDRHIREHERFPKRTLVSTESMPGNPGDGWRDVTRHVFVVGDNVWTAQDYLGESGIGRWFYEGDPSEPVKPPKGPDDKTVRPVDHGDDRLYPWHGAICGDLDLLGNRKPMAHWRNIVWDRGEKLFLAVRQPQDDKKIVVVKWGWIPTWESWTWPGQEGKPMEAEVYCRYEKVQLFLNGEKVGEGETNEANGFRAVLKVPYQPGTLKVVARQDGKLMGERELVTAQAAAGIRLLGDRATIHADGQDLCFVNVEVVDKNGLVQPNSDAEITFALTGPGAIAGLGNADLKSTASYQGTRCRAFHGQAQVVIRATTGHGDIQLKARSDGLGESSTSFAAE